MNYKTIFLCLFGIIVFGLAVYFLYYKEKKIEQFDNAYNIIESDRILPTIEPNAMFSVKSFSTIYGVQHEQMNYMSSLTNYVGGDIGGVNAYVQGNSRDSLGTNTKYLMENSSGNCVTHPIVPNNILGTRLYYAYFDYYYDTSYGWRFRYYCPSPYTFYYDYYSDPTSDFPMDYLRWRGQATNLIDKKIRGFLRHPLWAYNDIKSSIYSYEGLPELDGYDNYSGVSDDGTNGYAILHQGFEGNDNLTVKRLTGSLAAYQPWQMKEDDDLTPRFSKGRLDNATGEITHFRIPRITGVGVANE